MKYRYRSEDELKDSGVDWADKIPKDWKVKNFKHIFSFRRGLSITKSDLEESGIPCINYGEIHSKYRFELIPTRHELKCVSESYLDSNSISLLNYGDFVFCDTSEDIEGCGNFTYLNEHSEVFAGYHTMIVRPIEQINYRYMAYLLESNNWRFQIRSQVSGIKVYSITQSILKNTKVILPSLEEQKKLSSYLDTKCNSIDFAISKKESLIQRLEEAKKSLISEVITGKVKAVKSDDGYELVKRSSDEMTDSGVEWLGKIPKEWDAKRIKYLFKIKKNIAGKLGYDVLSVTQSGIKIKDITKNEGQLSMDYSKYQIVDIGDYVMNHMDLLTGFVDCSKYNGVTSPDYRVFRLIDYRHCKPYYNYIFQSCYYNRVFYSLAQGVSGMGRWRLQTDTFKNFVIPMPSYKEQDEIALFLDYKIKNIELLKNKLGGQIEKLKQAKQSLISEAVTGKIEILD